MSSAISAIMSTEMIINDRVIGALRSWRGRAFHFSKDVFLINFFKDRISLHWLGCPETPCVPASMFSVLGLQLCTSVAGYFVLWRMCRLRQGDSGRCLEHREEVQRFLQWVCVSLRYSNVSRTAGIAREGTIEKLDRRGDRGPLRC